MLSLSIVTAYLLAEDEAFLALDRRVLRTLGIGRMLFFSSGRKALDSLAKASSQTAGSGVPAGKSAALGGADILIVAERLGDMTGLQFLSHVRAGGNAAKIPALLIASGEKSVAALAARESRSCAVLARPYSLEQAGESLRRARMPEYRVAPMILPPSFSNSFLPRQRGKEEPPLLRRSPPKAITACGETSLREGIAAMRRGEMERAESLLFGSYRADAGSVETCLALSRLYAIQHMEKQKLAWLSRAGLLCLKRGEKTRAESLFTRLPRGRAGQNALLEEAGLALREGEAKTAAMAFLEAHRLDPGQQLHALVGRACMFTPAPEEHMRELIAALRNAGHEETAVGLSARLLPPLKKGEQAERSFLDNFPLLYDILSVAAHTFKTWRHAA